MFPTLCLSRININIIAIRWKTSKLRKNSQPIRLMRIIHRQNGTIVYNWIIYDTLPLKSVNAFNSGILSMELHCANNTIYLFPIVLFRRKKNNNKIYKYKCLPYTLAFENEQNKNIIAICLFCLAFCVDMDVCSPHIVCIYHYAQRPIHRIYCICSFDHRYEAHLCSRRPSKHLSVGASKLYTRNNSA